MGNTVDFKEVKRKNERGMSNSEFFDNCKQALIDSKTIVMVALSEDGFITAYRTSDSQLECLGMIDVAKEQLLNDMEL